MCGPWHNSWSLRRCSSPDERPLLKKSLSAWQAATQPAANSAESRQRCSQTQETHVARSRSCLPELLGSCAAQVGRWHRIYVAVFLGGRCHCHSSHDCPFIDPKQQTEPTRRGTRISFPFAPSIGSSLHVTFIFHMSAKV